ncbi:MAG TPA: hypothetical protein DD624_05270 [Alphaproteobacteria bacterium]|nr:hypothetical protein [Alphaproteobacteria bacterium]
MSDKLQWMNKHFVLLRHLLISDAVAKENYKIRPDLQDLFAGETNAESMVWKFAGVERYKCACELLAYISHRRAAVWWVYNCVLSLYDELGENPVAERDISEIGTKFEPTIPDFAKVEPPKPDEAKAQKALAKVHELSAAVEKLKESIDPEIMGQVQEGVDYAFGLVKEKYGYTPLELLKMALEKEGNPQPVDENSPIFKAADQLKAQLQTVRKETIDTIKSVIPPKVPAHEKQLSDNTMQAVYRWVVAPDEINSKKCLDVGNECPDTPAGLLALTAFWAGGNLMPEGEQVVQTPAGLAANGLCQVLLMCALHKGGTRKLKERYEHYFDLGVSVMTGEDNWDENVRLGQAPHEEERPAAAEPRRFVQREVKAAPSYHRWKPAIPRNDD